MAPVLSSPPPSPLRPAVPRDSPALRVGWMRLLRSSYHSEQVSDSVLHVVTGTQDDSYRTALISSPGPSRSWPDPLFSLRLRTPLFPDFGPPSHNRPHGNRGGRKQLVVQIVTSEILGTGTTKNQYEYFGSKSLFVPCT
eukprot:750928-Hanusia_phi.AAC.6